MLSPPLVNSEIWNDINKRAQTYDKAFRDIQSLIASGITPIFELLDILKEQIQSNEKARTLISDSITLLGQAQFNLSLRRRYMIRPSLKKKYANLCNINTPISTFLFGDDVHKEIKKCDTGLSITRDQYFNVPQHMNLRGCARHTEDPIIKAMVAVVIIDINHMVVSVDLQRNLVSTGIHFQKSPEGPQLSQVRRTGHR